MVSAAKKIVVVADHSKFSRQGLVSFATFDEVDALVTSEITDGAIRQEIQRLGVEVCTCPAAGGHMVRD